MNADRVIISKGKQNNDRELTCNRNSKYWEPYIWLTLTQVTDTAKWQLAMKWLLRSTVVTYTLSCNYYT